jgi:hypothetical protein
MTSELERLQDQLFKINIALSRGVQGVQTPK